MEFREAVDILYMHKQGQIFIYRENCADTLVNDRKLTYKINDITKESYLVCNSTGVQPFISVEDYLADDWIVEINENTVKEDIISELTDHLSNLDNLIDHIIGNNKIILEKYEIDLNVKRKGE